MYMDPYNDLQIPHLNNMKTELRKSTAYGYLYLGYVRMILFVCTYVCMYVYSYVCTYVCMYVHMYVCMYICMYVCINVSAHVASYVYTFVADVWSN